MIFYIVPLVFYFVAHFIGQVAKRSVLYSAIGLLGLIALVSFRGNVGTDTPYYVSGIDLIRNRGADSIQIFEPGFQIFLSFLSYFPLSPWAILGLIAFASSSILFFGWSRIEPPLSIFSVIVCYFFYDMTMNGVRYGLSFALVVLASSFLVRRQQRLFFLIGSIAVSIQISSILLAALVYFCVERKLRSLIYVFLGASILLFFFYDRLVEKSGFYESQYSPSILSGLVPLAGTSLVLLIWYFENLRQTLVNRFRGWFFSLIFVAAVLCFIVSQYSYAGLRLQQLILFGALLSFACIRYLRSGARYVRYDWGLYGIAFLLGLARLRSLTEIVPGAPANFLPYVFFWNELI